MGLEVEPAEKEKLIRMPPPPLQAGDIVRLRKAVFRRATGKTVFIVEKPFRDMYGFPADQMFVVIGEQAYTRQMKVIVIRWPGGQTIARKSQLKRVRLPVKDREAFKTEVLLGGDQPLVHATGVQDLVGSGPGEETPAALPGPPGAGVVGQGKDRVELQAGE